MAKILISPVGTGSKYQADGKLGPAEYRKARYRFEGEDTEYETSFVSSAILKKIKVDKLFLIGTRKSMWDEIYRYFSEHSEKELDEDYWMEISEKIENSSYKSKNYSEDDLEGVNKAIDSYVRKNNSSSTGGSKSYLIDYGLNEEELWENFDVFMEIESSLSDGDEVYIDITHSFRSIPIFMYLMMEFIQTLSLKGIELKGLYYGMLEATGEKGYAPIVDLSPIFEISKWIRGTYDFINYGNGYLIGELMKDQELKKKLVNISDLVSINYLSDFKLQINSLKKLLEKEGKENIRVLKYVAPRIESFISRFSSLGSDSDFQLELSKWYFENKRYGHGYICLVETILTKLCEMYGLDINNYYNRDMVKIYVVFKGKKSKIIRDDVYKKYVTINRIRMRIAHASLDLDTQSGVFRTDISTAFKHVEDVSNIIKKLEQSNLVEEIPLEEIRERYEERRNR